MAITIVTVRLYSCACAGHSNWPSFFPFFLEHKFVYAFNPQQQYFHIILITIATAVMGWRKQFSSCTTEHLLNCMGAYKVTSAFACILAKVVPHGKLY